MKLINKDALVAEIERKRSDYINSLMTEQVHVLNDVLDLLDTLEVKEVDLEKEKIKKASILHSFAIRNQEVEDEDFIEGAEWAIRQMRGESVSEDFTKALAECIHKAQCSVVDPLAHAEVWKEELVKLAKCEEPVSETNKVVQVRRCLEEAATTINSFIDEVIEQFNLKDKSIVAKEIQYRGVGLKGDFGENIHRSDDEVIYILKEDKTVGLIVIRRTEFNNAEITMVKTEERFKEKNND